jgi:hypothetical protein
MEKKVCRISIDLGEVGELDAPIPLINPPLSARVQPPRVHNGRCVLALALSN